MTGHRRYAPAQLEDAAHVRRLRDIGVGVPAIPALLAARDTPAWTRALELQREVLAGELSAVQGRLALVTRMLNEGEPTMSITVTRRTVPSMSIATLRGTAPTYSDEPQLWQRLIPLLTAQGLEPDGPCGVVEHDAEYTEHDVDLVGLRRRARRGRGQCAVRPWSAWGWPTGPAPTRASSRAGSASASPSCAPS